MVSSKDVPTPELEPDPEQTDKIRLVHDEVNRQRLALAVRRSNLQTRATVIIGGAGVGLTILGKDNGGWAAWTATGLAVAAAILGVLALEVVNRKGKELGMKAMMEATLSAASAYLAEHRIVYDKIEAHEDDLAGYARRNHMVSAGWAVLAASWVLSTVSLII
jgi:hypothetical protein